MTRKALGEQIASAFHSKAEVTQSIASSHLGYEQALKV
jgi:hypothetical protein